MIINRTALWAVGLSLAFSACDKNEIAPANQKETFAKYYGHVYSQTAADMETLSDDSGYLVLGSSSSFVDVENKGSYNNFYLIKTDPLGNELWSKSFGLTSNGTDIYDNTAQQLIALPDEAGYILAGNSQRIELQNGQRIRRQKRILLIQLDKDGVEVARAIHPVDFDTQPEKDWEVRDIQLLPNSNTGLVITGTTTDINRLKPNFNPQTDFSDMYLARFSDISSKDWDFSYGFSGKDEGVFLEVHNDNIIIAGRTETIIGNNPPSQDYHVVLINQSSGGILNQRAFVDSRNNIFATDATYDAEKGMLTIFGNEVASSGAAGQLVIMQFNIPNDRNNSITLSRTLKTNGSAQNGGVGSLGATISLLPDNQGFLMTATAIKTAGLNSDVQLLKFNKDLELEWDWLFGTGASLDKASAVTPVFKLGTNQVSDCAMVGTFDLGTNTTIGLVKTTNAGALDK